MPLPSILRAIEAAVAVAFSMVVLPGQWVPVLFVEDVRVVGLSLVILATGVTISTAAASRRADRSVWAWLRVPLAIAGAMTLGAIAFYRAIGGIGWPNWLELLLAPGFVVLPLSSA